MTELQKLNSISSSAFRILAFLLGSSFAYEMIINDDLRPMQLAIFIVCAVLGYVLKHTKYDN